MLKCFEIDLVNRISSVRKVKKNAGISKCEYSRRRPENNLGTSRINLPGTSLERQIRTSPGRQIGTSLGWSNRIFRGHPGEVGGGPIFAGWAQSLANVSAVTLNIL